MLRDKKYFDNFNSNVFLIRFDLTRFKLGTGPGHEARITFILKFKVLAFVTICSYIKLDIMGKKQLCKSSH